MKKALLCNLWILGLTGIVSVVSICFTFLLFSNGDYDSLVYVIAVLGPVLYGLGGYFLPRKCRPENTKQLLPVLIFWFLVYVAASYLYLWELVEFFIMDLVAIVIMLPVTYIGAAWISPFYLSMEKFSSEIAVLLGAVLLVGAFYVGYLLRCKKEKYSEV